MSLVSIVIPTFNREKYVREAILSATSQTVKDIEIIVIDNCSTDNTEASVLHLASLDNRIKFYKNSCNIGPVRNWINGINFSSSNYIKILFSDDLIAPNCIEKLLPPMLNPECAFSFSSAIIGQDPWEGNLFYNCFDSDTLINNIFFIKSSVHIFGSMPVSPGAAIFRKSDLLSNIFLRLDGIDDYDFSATGAGVDYLTYIVTALNYKNIYYCSTPTVYFRSHEGSLTIADVGGEVSLGYKKAREWFLFKTNIF
jgi:glycosyltransferase involved in cell wall biosynthesis